MTAANRPAPRHDPVVTAWREERERAFLTVPYPGELTRADEVCSDWLFLPPGMVRRAWLVPVPTPVGGYGYPARAVVLLADLGSHWTVRQMAVRRASVGRGYVAPVFLRGAAGDILTQDGRTWHPVATLAGVPARLSSTWQHSFHGKVDSTRRSLAAAVNASLDLLAASDPDAALAERALLALAAPGLARELARIVDQTTSLAA